MTWIHALFIVTLLKVILLTKPILEFKGSVWHNQGILTWQSKLTWFSKTDENLKYQWQSVFKNSLSSWRHLHGILLFLEFLILSEIFVILDNGRRRYLENLKFLFFKKLAEIPPLFCKTQRKIFKKVFC